MDHETARRPNLKDRPVDQRRNAARGGAASSPMDDGAATEGNATMRRVWSEPGGEAHSYRNAIAGAGDRDENHGELTAEETSEATRRLGDAKLPRQDRNAAGEAIERATTVQGDDSERG
jgi:hypothetical protein